MKHTILLRVHWTSSGILRVNESGCPSLLSKEVPRGEPFGEPFGHSPGQGSDPQSALARVNTCLKVKLEAQPLKVRNQGLSGVRKGANQVLGREDERKADMDEWFCKGVLLWGDLSKRRRGLHG